MDENRNRQETENIDDNIISDPPHVPITNKENTPFIQKQGGVPSWVIASIVGAILLGVILLLVSSHSKEDKGEPTYEDGMVTVTDDEEEPEETYELKQLYVDPLADSDFTAEDTKTTEYSGALDQNGQEDTYTFTAETSGRYGFVFHDINRDFSFRFNLTDSLGVNEIASAVDGPTEHFERDLEAGKQYTIKISNKYIRSSGTYYLTVYQPKPVVDITEYTIIHESAAFEMQVNKYTFTAKESGYYALQFSGLIKDMYIGCSVIDRLGYSVNKDSSISNEGFLSVTLNAGETYSVEVWNRGGTGSYTMKIWKQKPTVDISSYDVVKDSMQYRYQMIQYTFVPSSTGYYRFTASGMENKRTLSGKIYDTGDYCLGSNTYMSSGSYFGANLTEGNTYRIVLYQIDGLGQYDLYIEYEG